MFQTDLILSLQSLSSGALTFFMKAITVSGYEWFFVVLVMAVMLGVDLKKGFLLFQMIMWTGLLTEILKQVLALPRPTWVDSAVRNLESGEPNLSVFAGRDAPSFWQSLPSDVVEANRLHGGSLGFPSGHVSSAFALWGGLSILFKRRLLYWALPVMVVTMALSRMYLGRHFLADVLGGAALGGMVLLIARRLLGRKPFPNALLLAGGFGIPLLLPLLSIDRIALMSGYMAGVNGAFVILLRRGLPEDKGTLPKRILRVSLGSVLFLGISAAVGLGMNLKSAGIFGAYIRFLKAAIPVFLAFVIGIPLYLKLGLYAEIPHDGKGNVEIHP